MRSVAGILEMRYRYSNTIVYNNFVWPEVTESQKEKISKTAQAILEARALYPKIETISLIHASPRNMIVPFFQTYCLLSVKI